ncbi:MAG: galactose mutarotase [Prevotellaceae bacterium]|jgi:aldose 1-epimerase|nr:galactose mutarotase [Prevotellaceae bacterium]
MKTKNLVYCLFAVSLLTACCKNNQQLPLLHKTAFDTEVDGQPVSLYTLEAGDITLQVTNYGLRVVSLWTPDKNGKYADVAIGYENIERYIRGEGERFLGPVVGRYANRIAKGTFSLDGETYHLPLNNNGQTLHGGLTGLDRVAWNVDSVSRDVIHFSYVSPDGADGFPGTLSIWVDYLVTADNEFIILYRATTDKPTVVNLSNHAFFNLKGESNGTIADHLIQINADYITPIDSLLIPTGELLSVEGTPFDFRTATGIGERINAPHPQLKNGAGYDHNWVLQRATENDVEPAATLYEKESGRVLEVYTDQPGIQFYSGNFFDGKANGKYGKPIAYREALALETQKFPDSPNHENFPSTRLNPGEVYTQICIYKFSIFN